MKYVFYHANCNDGFGAALAAYKGLGKNQVKYIPVAYDTHTDTIGDLKLQGESLTDVYFVDFCPAKKVLLSLLDWHNVYVLDHHKTAKPTIDEAMHYENFYPVFNLEKSGARIAWEHFVPRTGVPNLIKYIEDRDLWKFKYGHATTNTFYALETIDRSFASWNRLLDNTKLDRLLRDCNMIEPYAVKSIERIAKQSYPIDFHGFKARVVYTPIYQSEVGNHIVKMLDADIGIMVQMKDATVARVSLRSEGDVDVSKIAQIYGGGGHQNAAGFVTEDLAIFGGRNARSSSKRTKRTSNRKKTSEEQK